MPPLHLHWLSSGTGLALGFGLMTATVFTVKPQPVARTAVAQEAGRGEQGSVRNSLTRAGAERSSRLPEEVENCQRVHGDPKHAKGSYSEDIRTSAFSCQFGNECRIQLPVHNFVVGVHTP